MSGASSEQGDNKLNVELNLVPFIDLLSSLVLFLLVTAVWLQVGTVPVSVDANGKARFASTESNRLTVHLSPQGFRLTWPTAVKVNLPTFIPTLNFQKLEQVLSAYPKAKSVPPTAVSSEDAIDYGLVIQAIDSLKRSGFSGVALSVE